MKRPVLLAMAALLLFVLPASAGLKKTNSCRHAHIQGMAAWGGASPTDRSTSLAQNIVTLLEMTHGTGVPDLFIVRQSGEFSLAGSGKVAVQFDSPGATNVNFNVMVFASFINSIGEDVKAMYISIGTDISSPTQLAPYAGDSTSGANLESFNISMTVPVTLSDTDDFGLYAVQTLTAATEIILFNGLTILIWEAEPGCGPLG